MTDDIILPPNSKAIPLTRGKYAIVDAEDFERLSQKKWHFTRQGYAMNIKYIRGSGRKNQKNTHVLMHKLIMNTPDGMDTDHISGDKLDNRKCNLRICTRSQNNSNRKKIRGTSKYKGVYLDKRRNTWVARIKIDGKCKYLGEFDSELKAAKIYNEAAPKYFGEFASLNII